MKWLAQHAPSYASGRIDLVKRYTSLSGANYYTPKDLLQLTQERINKVEELQTAMSYGMTKPDLSVFLKDIKKTIGDMAFAFSNKSAMQDLHEKAMADINELIFKSDNIKTEDLILEISLYYFFVDGEDPYIINPLTIQRKKKEALQDDALRAFFLNTTVALLKQSIENANTASQR